MFSLFLLILSQNLFCDVEFKPRRAKFFVVAKQCVKLVKYWRNLDKIGRRELASTKLILN